MTILLYNDGRLVIDDGNPIEGNSLEGLVACVADPQSGDTLKYDGKQWVAGAAASGLPDVTGDDDGKVLTVVDGAWAPAAAGGGGGGSDVFVVNYIYDETIENDRLDKTAAEIVAALQAGKTMLVCRFADNSYGTNTSFEANTFACTCILNSDVGSYDLIITASIGRSYYYFQASSADAYPTYYQPD